ncbi:unnamed protein product [Tuber aestivum]|uniref:Uncharacterized protein n=1 Tax=Tuber aestivum TaxID=59557 RepID=A0A292PKX0_9PEZI|nr:unnamed protein product [Tuber aestivum]
MEISNICQCSYLCALLGYRGYHGTCKSGGSSPFLVYVERLLPLKKNKGESRFLPLFVSPCARQCDPTPTWRHNILSKLNNSRRTPGRGRWNCARPPRWRTRRY